MEFWSFPKNVESQACGTGFALFSVLLVAAGKILPEFIALRLRLRLRTRTTQHTASAKPYGLMDSDRFDSMQIGYGRCSALEISG